MPKKILVFGATSAIAIEVLRNFAKEGASFMLLGRSSEKLNIVADDLNALGADDAAILEADLSQIEKHNDLMTKVESSFSDYDLVFLSYGVLGNQEEGQMSQKALLSSLNTNFNSAVSLLTYVSNKLEAKGSGQIAVITSVAGDRGRKSNYVYGSAKGALSLFCQGLRNRLFDKGVNVLTIKPGFVSTPMTSHLDQGPLFAKPELVGKKIYQAIKKKKDVIYVPSFWFVIMTIIKLIPEKLFKRLSI